MDPSELVWEMFKETLEPHLKEIERCRHLFLDADAKN